jgi:hypothetical protein
MAQLSVSAPPAPSRRADRALRDLVASRVGDSPPAGQPIRPAAINPTHRQKADPDKHVKSDQFNRRANSLAADLACRLLIAV